MDNKMPVFAKKLWDAVRILFFMIRKGKRKLLVDLNVMLKRGKIAGKSLGKLLFNHHSHPNDAASTGADSANGMFDIPEPPPDEYEFSCSNTPAHHNFLLTHVIPSLHLIGVRHRHNDKKGKAQYKAQYKSTEEEMEIINNVLEAMDLNDSVGASPVLPGLGFGKSPMVRQLRVTDSPFPISSVGYGDSHIDEAAEEFIKRFHSQLRRQPLTDS